MTLTHDEMVQILEQIARNGKDSDRISALRQLRLLESGTPAKPNRFDELDELNERRERRAG